MKQALRHDVARFPYNLCSKTMILAKGPLTRKTKYISFFHSSFSIEWFFLYDQEALKKVCSWQFTNCIDLWVTFLSENISEYDLQLLLFMIVQIINGVACLFLGPRYLPLRIKCIQWLNNLSCSSRIFIPVASYALDILEYKVGKVGGKRAKDFNFSSSVKVSKI